MVFSIIRCVTAKPAVWPFRAIVRAGAVSNGHQTTAGHQYHILWDIIYGKQVASFQTLSGAKLLAGFRFLPSQCSFPAHFIDNISKQTNKRLELP